jgi:hypothetical protein
LRNRAKPRLCEGWTFSDRAYIRERSS